MGCEIGGYLEMERFTGPMLHEEALALSSGRACLAYLIRQKKIRRMALPDFICDAVTETCRAFGVETSSYRVGMDLRPESVDPDPDEWLYLVNYYGQLTEEEIRLRAEKHPLLIADNAHAYFDRPVRGVDTLYTCRKFFGVADGGFLYTDAPDCKLERDESHMRMGFVLGRFERPAGEFFAEAARNNDALSAQPRMMSALTGNLLHGVDYEHVRAARTENYRMLDEALGAYNRLSVRPVEGAYAYPLMLENGPVVREKLIARKIFVPQLWPNVLREQPTDSAASRLTREILPLPCDQRYGQREMETVIQAVCACLE